MQSDNAQWETIGTIWQNNKWLYSVVGWLIGIITFPLLNRINADILTLLDDLVPEILGLVITVLLIDRLYEIRQNNQMKKRLLERLGSRINAIAVTAAEELWAYDWWADGSLAQAQLSRADLRGADFGKANLTNAELSHPRFGVVTFDETTILPDNTSWHPETDMDMFTNPKHEAYWCGFGLRNKNLSGMNYVNKNLRGADLRGCKCIYTNFSQSDLRGADLKDADLMYANMKDARFDTDTTLPDGSFWHEDSDLSIFNIAKQSFS
ncbi:MAG: pentapeptide repeat-containing protein [Chloroflexota bacterium]